MRKAMGGRREILGSRAMPLSPGSRPMARNCSSGLGALKARCGRSPASLNKCSSRLCRLQEQLKKFQEDVDFRFHDGVPAAPAAKPPQKRSEAPEAQTFADDALGAPGAPAPQRQPGRGDAFDPSQNPGAPGAPRPLGSPASASRPAASSMRRDETANSDTEQNDPGAPLDLSNGRSARPEEPRQRLRPN